MYIIKVYKKEKEELKFHCDLPYFFEVEPINICSQMNEMLSTNFYHIIGIYEHKPSLFENLKIPYGYLLFFIHILKTGLIHSNVSPIFDSEKKWIQNWINTQEKELVSDEK